MSEPLPPDAVKADAAAAVDVTPHAVDTSAVSGTSSTPAATTQSGEAQIEVSTQVVGELGDAVRAIVTQLNNAGHAVPVKLIVESRQAIDDLPSLADMDQHEGDLLRPFCTAWRQMFASKLASVRGSGHINRRVNICVETVLSIREACQQDVDKLEWDLERSREGEAEEDVVAITELQPSSAKDYRPRGTPPSPAAPLRQTDFAVRPGGNLHGNLTELQLTIKKAGFKRKDAKNDFFYITWPPTLTESVDDCLDYTLRRVTRLLEAKVEISQALCNQAFDDAVEYLLRSGKVNLKTYTRDQRSAWWLERQGKSKVRNRVDFNITYIAKGRNSYWRHETFARGSRQKYITMSLTSTPDYDPEEIEESPLPLAPEPPLIAGKEPSDVVDGFTVEKHRRARAWIYNEAIAWYNHMFPDGWVKVDALTLGQRLSGRDADSKAFRKAQQNFRDARNVGRRGQAPFRTEINTHREIGSMDDYYIVLDTRYKFGDKFDKIEGDYISSALCLSPLLTDFVICS